MRSARDGRLFSKSSSSSGAAPESVAASANVRGISLDPASRAVAASPRGDAATVTVRCAGYSGLSAGVSRDARFHSANTAGARSLAGTAPGAPSLVTPPRGASDDTRACGVLTSSYL